MIVKHLRSVIAVVLGYVLFAVTAVLLFRVSGREPHAPQPLWFILLATASGVLFAGLGGALAARIASSRPLGHAAALALLVAIGAGVSLLQSPATDATWSMWSALLVMAPSAYGGGYLGRRR